MKLYASQEKPPDAAVEAEEQTPTASRFPSFARQRPLIVLDPVDGTLNYAQDSRDYAAMGALIKDGFYRSSVIYFPAREEMYWAITGQGAWCRKRNKRPRQSAIGQLPDYILITPGTGDRYHQVLSALPLELQLSRCSAVDSIAPAAGIAKAAASVKNLDRRRAIGFLISRQAGGFVQVANSVWNGEDPYLLTNPSPQCGGLI